MKNIWIESHGVISRPVPLGSSLLNCSPFSREKKDAASSHLFASIVFRVAFFIIISRKGHSFTGSLALEEDIPQPKAIFACFSRTVPSHCIIISAK